ncbi:ketose-bisphosphate aldolase [Mammaliicoccus sciuri]|uniref:ketose-bisphosphate aldolase n=1 Tax=Mammaliicoccus sciuri TaxID=1296 RepID=UPI0021D1CF8D|nr:ketose-bisphosphate aldolase [Mammaliicoccus sciuri]UXU83601.1 ketose-bisphosphate aldolase [Mammaliicoccus sciuri]UXU93447.1 ketose-bisphosphate aldolase [Mammaliicoccus sciuri]UXV15395.1 ketose-bisphosphate aldolase [Mammaliicoccus sciuri]UXV23660.1 ketose-bisphosphate aldolase [Mammaliicoccus sciuri]UXV26438.1 ketose-bisphosphate aldolase [Mammaliicoccus sciuri]
MRLNFIEFAKKEKFAIPQININGLIWIEGILKAAQNLNSPIIIGTTDKNIEFLGGYKFISNTIKNKIQAMNITVPVYIHLDHGLTVEGCKEAVDAGYDSVMFDGSKLSISENIRLTKEVVDYAHEHNVFVEGEVGAIGGVEDGLSGQVRYADIDECLALVKETNLDTLAPALGSVHGKYKGEPNLGFEEMELINENTQVPLVLHGASGISKEDLHRAISLGHAKINFNTEINIAWSNQLRKTLTEDKNLFSPQEIIRPSIEEIQKTSEKIINLCGSNNKSDAITKMYS